MKYRNGDRVVFTQERIERALLRTAKSEFGSSTPTDSHVIQYAGKELTINNVTSIAGVCHVELDGFYGAFNEHSISHAFVSKNMLDEELFTI